MAVKQEIKYKVRKLMALMGEEGKILLNAIKDGARYLVHRAVVAQANKKRQGTASTKLGAKLQVAVGNLGNKKVLVMQDLDLVIHLYGLEEELAFGPRPRSYKKKINVKERRLAITTALHYNFSKVTVVEKLVEDTTKISTSYTMSSLRNVLNFSEVKSKKLIIIDKYDKNLALSMRNIKNVKLTSANAINVIDLLEPDQILVTENALKHICEVYSE
jgi:large subunit ribosomal protein L4